MKVAVLLFARLREIAQTGRLEIELCHSATVGDLAQAIASEYPQLKPWLNCSSFAVNGAFTIPSDPVREFDEIALIPPVSGGGAKPDVSLTWEEIKVENLLNGMDDSENGAVVLFLGNVRAITGSHTTDRLFYEAYEALAVKEFIRIGDEATFRFGLGKVRIMHRLGDVLPGKSSVGVVVKAPHRAEAFQGCGWIMDQIKKTAPLWKKEHTPEGRSFWVHPGAPEGQETL